jgi:hypothetical protein
MWSYGVGKETSLLSAMLRIYVDTCVVSGLAKPDLSPPTIEALWRILDLHEARHVHLLTSSVMKDEIAKIPEQYRTPHRALYTLLAKIPIAATHRTDSGMMLLEVGRGRPADRLFKGLRSILPDEADARHVFQAVKNGVNYFLTVDKKTILRHRAAVENYCGIKVFSPKEMVEVIETLSGGCASRAE